MFDLRCRYRNALTRRPTPVIITGLFCLLIVGSWATQAWAKQTQLVCGPAPADAVDNRDGYFVNLEEAPVHPLELSTDGSELWAVNIPDARVSVFDLQNPAAPALVAEVAVGLGPVSIRSRNPSAGNEEMWVLCQSSNSLFVIDRASREVTGVKRLVGEPTGLEFSADLTHAYVTLAANHQVVILNAATLAETGRIETASTFPLAGPLAGQREIHIDEPRVVRSLDGEAGERIFVLSYQSSNGTLVLPGAPSSSLNSHVIFDAWGAVNLPPDRDVLRFDPAEPSDPGEDAAWRLGTLNFDLLFDDAGQMLVSNVDLLNQRERCPPDTCGEHNFKANGFAVHRISIQPPLAGGAVPNSGGPAQLIDLNEPTQVASALLTAGYSCSVPTQMALSVDGSRLFVACYETHNIAVIDLVSPGGPQVMAELRGEPNTGPPAGQPNPDLAFGARGVALLEGEGQSWLYTYFRGNNQLVTFDVSSLTSGELRLATDLRSMGFDITTQAVRNGRFHLINAKNSTFGTGSCNTCHMDGHLDGIAWDLGAFTGQGDVAPEFPDFPRNDKRLKVTMSLRGIEETPPFHWRGDRADLADFNPAFEGLLGGEELSASELEELDAFVFSLSYPANPRQKLSRDYRVQARTGLACFVNQTAETVDLDEAGTRANLSCSQCHGMAGSSGTNNQVVNAGANLLGDATQLRGLWDKETDIYSVQVGGAAFEFPASGYGLGNTGADSLNIATFPDEFDDLPVPMRPPIGRFLVEFDTGMAPTTALAYRLTGTEVVGALPSLLTALLNGAAAGHNDVIGRGWATDSLGREENFGVLYQPAGAGTFVSNDPGRFPATNLASLISRVNGGEGGVVLMGTPVKTGYRLGLDRDMDFLPDGEEVRVWNTTASNPDSDGDGFPDGYEVRLGSVPTAPGNTPAVEVVAPLPVSGPSVRWRNGSIAKVEWSTDEESTTLLEVLDGGTVLWTGLESQFKKEHVMVARNLPVGKTVTLRVTTEDPADPAGTGVGNSHSETFQLTTDGQVFESVHVEQTRLQLVSGPLPGENRLRASFVVVDGKGDPVTGAMVNFDVIQWSDGTSGHTVNGNLQAGPTNSSGTAVGLFLVPVSVSGPGAFGEVIVGEVSDAVGQRFQFRPLAGEFGFFDKIPLP
ncbi:MAG: hypothetical protein K0U98_28505 [Deltaproteobacteria bacterium]|nr:hypothetical protein [Deltaproteobacteria bacterium]